MKNESDLTWELKMAGSAALPRRRGRPKKAQGVPNDIRAAIPLGRHPMAQRLAYGLSLMARGEDGVYGERYE